MGIKKLKQVIEKLCMKNGVSTYSNLSEFANEYKKEKNNHLVDLSLSTFRRKKITQKINSSFITVAIDVSLFGHKYKRNFGLIEYGFLKQILSCLSSKIIPIYVFDGKSPNEKKNVIKKRIINQQNNKDKLDAILCYTNQTIQEYSEYIKELESLIQLFKDFDPSYEVEPLCNTSILNSKVVDSNSTMNTPEICNLKRKSIYVDSNDISRLQQFFDELGITYIVANGEADSMISKLSTLNYVDACLSEDSDMLPKGCKNVIHIKNNIVYRYNLNDILTTLGITYHLFIDYCILLGCDYYKISQNIDPYKLLSLIKQNMTLTEILKNIYGCDQKTIDYCVSLRVLFYNSNEEIGLQYQNIQCKLLNPHTIFTYFTKNTIQFDSKTKEIITNKILLINRMLTNI